MKSAVLVFPGSNREGDVAQALELVTGSKPQMVWHGDSDFRRCRSGRAAGRLLLWRLSALRRHGRAVAGHGRGEDAVPTRAAGAGDLQRLSGRCRSRAAAGRADAQRRSEIRLRRTCTSRSRPARACSPRYQAGQVISVPVAHGEGNYFADAETLNRLEGRGPVAFRYAPPTAPRWQRQSQRLGPQHRRHPQRERRCWA